MMATDEQIKNYYEIRARKHWAVSFWILILVNVIMFVCGGLVPLPVQRHPFHIAVFVSFVTLLSLMGVYAGLGKQIFRWPLVVIGCPVLGVIGCYGIAGNSREIWGFLVFAIGISGVTAFTTVLLRFFKGELRQVDDTDEIKEALQFKIKHLFIWTTVAAIMVSVGQYVWAASDGVVTGTTEMYLSIFGLALIIAVAVVIDIWAVLGKELAIHRMIVLVFSMAIGCFLIQKILPLGDSLFFPMIGLGSQLMGLLLAWMIRIQGYRFVKH